MTYIFIRMEETVIKVARAINLLAPDGSLKPLDSLQMIDLVQALEEAIDITIPTAALKVVYFQSISSITQLLSDVSAQNVA